MKALEDQFYDTCSLCFSQLKAAEECLSNVRSSVQRMFSIQTSLSRCRNGGHSSGRMKKAIKAFLALFMIQAGVGVAMAGEYPVLVNTNLAQMLGPSIQWRSFIEPEVYTVITTNWTQSLPSHADTNGLVKIYEVSTIVTNRSIKFTFEGKHYVQTVSQDRGPILGMRESAIPTPIPLPMRTR